MDNNHYEAAIQAVAAELHNVIFRKSYVTEIRRADLDYHKTIARAVIDAALPHIGEHIAAAIETIADAAIETIADGVTGSPSYRHVYIDALQRGANIARYLTQPHTTTRPTDSLADIARNLADYRTELYSAGPDSDF